MAERLHPGVYVEEVSSGVRPIEGVSTSTAAFLGVAQRGQPNRPTLVTSFAEFETAFGGHADGADGFLAAAAEGFFGAGGRRAYIVRVLPASAVAATVSLPVRAAAAANRRQPFALALEARGTGAWGNDLRVAVLRSERYPNEAFTLQVSRVQNGLSRILETFADVRMDETAEDSVERVVNESSAFLTVVATFPDAGAAAGDDPVATLPAIRPSLTGVMPTHYASDLRFALDVNQGDTRLGPTHAVTLPARPTSGAVLTIEELRTALGADFVVSAPNAQGEVVISLAETVADGVPANTLSIVLRDEIDALHRVAFSRTYGFPTRVNGYAANDARNPLARPARTDAAVALANGTDGTSAIAPSDFFGNAEARTGLWALDTVTVNMVAIPGRTTDTAFVAALVPWCEQHAAFAILDGPGAFEDDYSVHPLDARNFIDSLPIRSKNAAMYYPWIQTADPLGVGRNPRRFVPPSGHVAGIYARTDNSRGVWKAPAGIEATVSGAVGLQYLVSDSQQDVLNPVGLACIRQFSGTGIVVWGARTISSDPEWRYVPVRRTALFLMESIRLGMQWAVFEPNDVALWERIRMNIYNFMLRLFQEGAFQGATPTEAFLVRCDATTNPQANIDAGIVTAKVFFAPLKPAEFVVIQVSQKTLVV